MSDVRPPVRACNLELKLGADSRDDILAALNNIKYMIAAEKMTSGVSGGVNSGYSYTYTESAKPTTEEYHKQLDAYLEASKS